MAQRNIDFGTFPDDPDADAIRTAFQKTQENFTELFGGLQDQAVISVNRTAGAGITVNSPTGNVIVTANIACVQVSSNTLGVSRDSASYIAGGNATLTSSSQTLVIELPNDIANVDNITLDANLTANVVKANLNVLVGSNAIVLANTGNATIGNASISGVLGVTGNVTVGNISTVNGTFSNAITVTTAANVGALNATTGAFTGTMTANNANVTNNVAANIVTANFFYGDGTNISNVTALPDNVILNASTEVNIPSPNSSIFVSVAGTANVLVIGQTGANITGYANVTGNISAGNATLGNSVTANYFVGNLYGAANTATSATTAGTVTTNAQPNITSVGTLTSLNVTGNVDSGNVNATGGVFTYVNGNGANLTSLTGANVTGSVANATYANGVAGANVSGEVSYAASANSVAGGNVVGTVANATHASTANTVVDATQSNITSVGTLTGLNVNGTITAASITANTGVFTGNGSGLTNLTGANVTGTVANATYATSAGSATTAGTVTTNAQPNITSVGTLTSLDVTGNVTASNVYANSGTIGAQTLKGEGGNISNIQGANVSGTVSSATTATTAGTVTTNAQPNITSVGSLTSLTVTGNINAGNVSLASGIFSGNGSGLSQLTAANINGTVANATYADNAGNATNATSATSATTSGTVTTNAQPNITSVGTLSSLAVTGNTTSGNVYANSGTIGALYLAGDGSNITNISVGAGSYIENGNSEVRVDANSNVRVTVAGNANVVVVTGTGANITGYANITGNVSAGNVSATLLTGTLTTASQPNVTSLGTLTGLNVNGTSNLGPNSNVIITGGVANAFLKTDGSGALSWDTATLVPAQGSNTQVIFNDGGSTYAGSANLTFDKTTRTLTVANAISAANIIGTIAATSSSQPNIREVGNLGSLTVAPGSVNQLVVSGTNVTIGTNRTNNLTIISNTVAAAGTKMTFGVTEVSNLTASYVQVTSGNIDISSANDDDGLYIRTTAGSFPNNRGGTVYAANGYFTTVTGTLTTAAQTNITSVGTLSSLSVTGNTTTGNLSGANAVTANFFIGSGNNLSNIQGANVTGTVSSATSATTAGTVTTNAQPNITSIGTLSSLVVNGNINAGNLNTTGVFNGNGASLTNIPGANVTGTVANATFATTAGSTTTAGTVTTNAQPNITSVGTLSSLTVSGNASAGNLNAGNLLTANFVSGTLTTAAQPNITSLGSLTSLIVNGNINAGNVAGGNLVSANFFSGNGSGLTALNASNISTGTLAQARLANSSLTVNGTSISLGGSGTITAANPNALTLGTYLTGTSYDGSTAVTAAVDATTTNTANKVVARDTNGSFSANIITATLSGSATSATTAGTVTTNAQPNITSVGTLNSANIINNTTGYSVQLPGIVGSATTDSRITTLSSRGTLASPTQIQSGDVLFTVAPQAYTGSAFTGAGRIQITATENINASNRGSKVEFIGIAAGGSTGYTMSWNGSTLQVDGAIGANSTITGTRLISNVATGTAPFVVTSTTQVANLSVATAGSATTAGTVTTAAQPNITSVGTLTSLTSSGNISGANLVATSYTISSVATSISAAGSTQGTATALTKDVNVVSTVSAGQGVVLPTAVGGMRITVMNTSPTALNVYPATGAGINNNGANVAFALPGNGRLDFLAVTSTQWYTLTATYA
jgi:hypothetical protein